MKHLTSPANIHDLVKRTVGFNESDNKDEFLRGAAVATNLLIDLYEQERVNIQQTLDIITHDRDLMKNTISMFHNFLKRIENFGD